MITREISSKEITIAGTNVTIAGTNHHDWYLSPTIAGTGIANAGTAATISGTK
jgi:hypothetical protein